MYDKTQEEFLKDLCPRVRAIIEHIMDCSCGCEALDLFQKRPRSWNECKDIAFYLKRPTEDVASTLNLLHDLGAIQSREIFEMTFYHLTDDSEILEALDQYWTWRELWRSRWRQMQSSLKL